VQWFVFQDGSAKATVKSSQLELQLATLRIEKASKSSCRKKKYFNYI